LITGADWTNMYACGGAVLSSLLKENAGADHSDVDLFLCTDSEDEATSKLHALHKVSSVFSLQWHLNSFLSPLAQLISQNSLARISIPIEVFKSTRTITIKTPYTTVQIVLALFKSVAEVRPTSRPAISLTLVPSQVLYRFDIDSCCVAYDGTNVWVTERARRAINKRYPLGLCAALN